MLPNVTTCIATAIRAPSSSVARSFASKASKKFGGTRGTRGHGWLTKYRENRGGRQLQGKWANRDVENLSKINDKVFELGRSHAFLDFLVDKGNAGGDEEQQPDVMKKRIVVELAETALPNTVKNFLSLLEDEEVGYKNTCVTKIEKKVGICFEAAGRWCHPSVSETGRFDDEGFFISHTADKFGILSMMSPGVHKNDSRFVITTKNAPQLDGKFVAFGRVVEDVDDVLKDLESVFTKRGVPASEIKVINCGRLP